MRKHSGAKIFNISSISGLTGFPALSPYVSSKFAVEGFTESLRLELLPLGIDAALIEPGSYKTSIWETSLSIILRHPAKIRLITAIISKSKLTSKPTHPKAGILMT